MKSFYAPLAALVLAMTAWSAATAEEANTADAEVRGLARQFVEAWNAHDASAIAALWTEDGDVVLPTGQYIQGRAAIEHYFAEEFGGSGGLRESHSTVQTERVRTVSPDVAVADWDVVLRGIVTADGQPMPPHGHRVVMVVTRSNGKWLFNAARPGVMVAGA